MGWTGLNVRDSLQAKELMQDLLDAMPEASAIVYAGRVLHVNREFTRLFEYPAAECEGQELADLVVPEGRLHERELILHSLASDGIVEMETVRRTRAGEAVDVSLRIAKVRLGGRVKGVLVSYRDIRRQKLEAARLQHTARHDVLTGLANRALFLERVELTLSRLRRRPDRRFAVVFLDLNGFKKVNDTLGHAAGDTLLLVIAERLKRSLRPQDAVARFGGDEFALLLDECAAEADVECVVNRLRGEIERPIEISLDGAIEQAFVSASMGIAMATASYAAAEEILMHADAAMYEAKAARDGRHVFHHGKGALV